MTRVLDAIKAQGVAATDIQTSQYNVFPITNPPKEGETPRITGYRVTNIVSVKVRQIANVGSVMDAAIEAGANNVGGVFFSVDNPAPFEEQARTQAVKDAMAKAQTLASAAGVRVGRILTITETSGPVIPLYKEAFAVPAAQAAGPIETGSTEITVSVEMHFEIAQ
jgi:uncharacterized protein YggE